MNKLIAMTIISLGFAQQGLANVQYSCGNPNGETLEIYENTKPQGASLVTATLEINGVQEAFKGAKKVSKQGLSEYLLKDSEENIVDLTITEVNDYGGRCGRCAVDSPIYKISTYAKLTLASGAEFNFTCAYKKLVP